MTYILSINAKYLMFLCSLFPQTSLACIWTAKGWQVPFIENLNTAENDVVFLHLL